MISKEGSQGYVLWEGPSSFTGEPIVLIATGFITRSVNVKTGPMLQTYILKQDKAPSEVIRAKEDKGVCNNCKFGAAYSGACYVNVVTQGPNQIWKAYRKGFYPHIKQENLLVKMAGESLRCGAYGDPVAVPLSVWEPIIATLRDTGGMWTSYTHSWKEANPGFKEFTVASVDNPQELAEARAAGWRTFRTLTMTEELQDNEFMCPATPESGKAITCADCGACNGNNGRGTRGSATIRAHGTVGKKKRYDMLRTSTQ